MEENFSKVLLKFMDTLNINQTIEIDRSGIDSRGNQFVCVKIQLERKGHTEYLKHHCYIIKVDKDKNIQISYAEGNEIVGADKGIMGYLGSKTQIDLYFERLSRNFIRNILNKVEL